MNNDFTLDKLDKSIRRLIKRGNEFSKTEDFIKDVEKIPKNLRNLVNNPLFSESKTKFDFWLNKLFQINEIPSEINGLYFGLFETSYKRWFKMRKTISVYVAGSNSWDKNNPDWACDDIFNPENKYLQLEIIEHIYNSEKYNIYTKYFLVLSVIYIYIKYFFEKSLELEYLINKEINLALGFDDGDLYNLFQFPTKNSI